MSVVKNGPNRGWSMMDLQIFFSPTLEALERGEINLRVGAAARRRCSRHPSSDPARGGRASLLLLLLLRSLLLISSVALLLRVGVLSSYTSVITIAQVEQKNPR